MLRTRGNGCGAPGAGPAIELAFCKLGIMLINNSACEWKPPFIDFFPSVFSQAAGGLFSLFPGGGRGAGTCESSPRQWSWGGSPHLGRPMPAPPPWVLDRQGARLQPWAGDPRPGVGTSQGRGTLVSISLRLFDSG